MLENRASSLHSLAFSFLISILILPSSVSAQSTDLPPEIAAPDTVTGIENLLVTFQATASDPEGDPMVYFYGGSLPPDASFVADSTNSAGTFSWMPDFVQGGTYEILLSASSARRATEVSRVAGPLLTSRRTVYLRVLDQDRPPVLHAPDRVTGAELVEFHFRVHASDSDGDFVVVTMSDLPAGATARSLESGAEFTWMPQSGQAGEYSATVTARSRVSHAIEIVPITVISNALPILEGPAQVDGKETELVTFQVHASDPDGDEVVLTHGYLPGSAAFTVQSGHTGTFSWTPGFRDAGLHTIELTARSAVRAAPVSGPVIGYQEDRHLTRLLIADTDRPPTIPQLMEQVVDEGATLRKEFYVTDPDWDIPELTLFGPGFARLEQEFFYLGMTRGVLVLEPGFRDAGVYSDNRIQAVSGQGSATATFSILVRDRNAPPVVVAPELAGGTEGSVLAFDVTAADPDGEAVVLEMIEGPGGSSFVDRRDNTGAFAWTPGYDQSGEHVARFTARDTGGLVSDPVVVPIHVADLVLEAHAFLETADQVIRLESGKPTVCVQVEAVANGYQNDAVDLGSIVMRSTGTGSATEIEAPRGTTAIGGDRNRNGIAEITACFAKEDVRLLFDGLPRGPQNVPVSIEGRLWTGAPWRASLGITVTGLGRGIHVVATPNPAPPNGTLLVRTTRAGSLTARLYDIQGRLVRTLANSEHRDAGTHAFPLDGGSDDGARLKSGVYFYKVISVEGERSGRLIVAR
ncbi:MAG TPA: Ig-like domain-containing protein [Candidatus Eisenbacteria bacterium]|nr:Ig-like domain-containing protein [Candidatus Eisenbacteria bacterium]